MNYLPFENCEFFIILSIFIEKKIMQLNLFFTTILKIFVCLFAYSHLKIFQLSGGCHYYQAGNLDICLAPPAFSSEGYFTCDTCCNLRFYGLIRRKGTHVLQ
jgi:hypothetical protein